MKRDSARILRRFGRFLLPAATRDAVKGWLGMPRDPFDLPAVVDKPPGHQVMVMAAHPDDETVGCGGTLHKHHLAGDKIVAVFLTDGSQGYAFTTLRGEPLIARRQEEAQQVAATLGIGDCVFLRHPDTRLARSRRTCGQVLDLLKQYHPDILYVPSWFDTHADHRAAVEIAAAALADYPHELTVYMYELWSPLPANCVVRIDMEVKVQAIRAYQSQMDDSEIYSVWARSMGKYRALSNHLEDDAYAECFWRADKTDFLRAVTDTRLWPFFP